jgi:hypothetical protein
MLLKFAPASASCRDDYEMMQLGAIREYVAPHGSVEVQ